MKKLIIAILIITVMFIVVACEDIQPGLNLQDYVSYYETHLYTGETTNFAVAIVRGKREDAFLADGAVGNLVEFATMKVTPLHMDLFNKAYTYKLTGANGELTGELSKDMFGVSFSTEIDSIDTIGDLLNVTIITTGIEDTVELTNKLKDMLDWENVLSVAAEEFQDKIDGEIAAESFNREIHIKFINNRTDRSSPYYWYVAFITSTNDYWAILIDPETGDIISKKG